MQGRCTSTSTMPASIGRMYGENPPVGLILCAQKDHAVARYALEGLPNKVLAAEYRTALPDEKTLAAEIDKTRRMLEGRGIVKSQKGKGK